jgi:hypothetical protein
VAGPWEKYAAPAASGPWARYAAPASTPEVPLEQSIPEPATGAPATPEQLQQLEERTVEPGLGDLAGRIFMGAPGVGGLGKAVQGMRVLPQALSRAAPKAVSQLPQATSVASQVAPGPLKRAMESIGGHIPIARGMVDRARQARLAEWNTRLLQEFDAGINKAGPEGFQQAGQAVSKAYKDIWKETIGFNRQGLRESWGTLATNIRQNLPKQQADEVVEQLQGQFKQVLGGAREGGTQGATLEAVDDALRELSKKAYKAGDGRIGKAYESARTAFRGQMDEATDTALKRADQLNLRLATLRDASKRGFGETITPDKLMAAAVQSRRANPRLVSEGRAAYQQEAADAAKKFGMPTSTFQRRIEDAIAAGLAGGFMF